MFEEITERVENLGLRLDDVTIHPKPESIASDVFYILFKADRAKRLTEFMEQDERVGRKFCMRAISMKGHRHTEPGVCNCVELYPGYENMTEGVDYFCVQVTKKRRR